MGGLITPSHKDASRDSIRPCRISCDEICKTRKTGQVGFSIFYYTYNTRSSKSLKSHTPYDMFFKQPNFSLQTGHSRNNLSREEIEFLDMDHVPLEGGFDDVDGDVEDEGQCEHAGVPGEDICLDSGDIISPEADVTGNDGAEYEAAGDNSDGTDDVVDTDIPALPTSPGDLEATLWRCSG